MRSLRFVAVAVCLLSASGESVVRAADRALIIGIDQYQRPAIPPLMGAANDAQAMRRLLLEHYGFAPAAIRMLLDRRATAEAIRENVRDWLIAQTQAGDRVFFYFAGHGSQLPDDDGDEDDGCDETIVPTDTECGSGINEIRDDEFAAWVSQLPGRRVVFIFDSCHSGTMNRGASSWRNPRVARGCDRCEARKVSAREPRDLAENRPGNSAGVLFIQASHPEESASSLVASNSEFCRGYIGPSCVPPSLLPGVDLSAPHGAFTAVFIHTHRNGVPTVGALRKAMSEDFKRLRPYLMGVQQPLIQSFSSVPSDDQPLFGTWQTAAKVALTNRVSPIVLGFEVAGNRRVYHARDELQYRLTTNTSGYLYLLVFSSGNRVSCLYPYRGHQDNRVAAGTVDLPLDKDDAIKVGPPYGHDVAVAVLSKERLPLGGEADMPSGELFASYDWNTVFTRIRFLPPSVAEHQQQSDLNRDSDTWQAASVDLLTEP